MVSVLEQSPPAHLAETPAVPRSIAIIPDGNRRWAKMNGLSVRRGHEAGGDNILRIVRAAQEMGIEEVTIFCFSTENWQRNTIEVQTLLLLFRHYLTSYRDQMVAEGVQFHAIGNLEALPRSVQKTIAETERATAAGQEIKLIIPFNYGGRDEIRRATQKLLDDFAEGKVQREDITEELLSQYMDTAPFIDPELLIRTSGENRISNFLLWQSSYSEFYTTPVYWPDFTPERLREAIHSFQARERRIGS